MQQALILKIMLLIPNASKVITAAKSSLKPIADKKTISGYIKVNE
jgi:hypothetical protein